MLGFTSTRLCLSASLLHKTSAGVGLFLSQDKCLACQARSERHWRTPRGPVSCSFFRALHRKLGPVNSPCELAAPQLRATLASPRLKATISTTTTSHGPARTQQLSPSNHCRFHIYTEVGRLGLTTIRRQIGFNIGCCRAWNDAYRNSFYRCKRIGGFCPRTM
ncbi:hypothetical protein EDB80DRAFT_205189 [Ilyonectria destructans]|nr:hypothetical protein EDB80DRAFT_205189 [Ilyonectria destructans]